MPSSPIPPPLLPERRLLRVLRLARVNSLGVMICAGVSLLLSLLGGSWVFAAFAAMAVVCGWMEWSGHLRLAQRDANGLTWLLGAQACLYTVIVGYALWRLRHFNAAEYWAALPPPARDNIVTQMSEAGLDPEKERDLLLRMMNFVVCAALVGASTLYQGGLALWYRLQRTPVLAALGENPSTATERDG